MLTAAAVRTAVYFHCLSIAVLLFAFCPDMAQFPSVMADVIMLILEDSVRHVVILPDIFLVLSGKLAEAPSVRLDETFNPVE